MDAFPCFWHQDGAKAIASRGAHPLFQSPLQSEQPSRRHGQIVGEGSKSGKPRTECFSSGSWTPQAPLFELLDIVCTELATRTLSWENQNDKVLTNPLVENCMAATIELGKFPRERRICALRSKRKARSYVDE